MSAKPVVSSSGISAAALLAAEAKLCSPRLRDRATERGISTYGALTESAFQEAERYCQVFPQRISNEP